MRTDQPLEIKLKDYQVPDYLIDETKLHFELGESGTLVRSQLSMRTNPESNTAEAQPLVLHGAELTLRRIAIDGKTLQPEEFLAEGERLTISSVPAQFELECVTFIKPHENSSLEGLYRSNDMFCTQCEAEGFRKITYFLDRPDVMSVFTTTIVANKKKYPVLLSNGNNIDRGDLEDDRHWVTWHDPFKKPAYLFALVAGDLVNVTDSFTTVSGREIKLQIFVEHENIDKCDHGMKSLKKAMVWDEQVYGREYDLDLFMIVAVNDFNMGAMENKGLNIFNSSCVLAKPDTATDATYERIEAIVAHEYFHNWSGNRVTCRDWFQLSLKEGFTVFRDQEFSADMGSRTVKRIDDVSMLRTAQFAEDAGPMAHPIRPASYMEISNFYTLTVYEKGAEVVRMIHTLLGEQPFRRGSDLYFERHDGQAVTTDDFVQAMEDATGKDLQQFRRWYSQAGTPRLAVDDDFDADTSTYTLNVKQYYPELVVKTDTQPLHLPLAFGALNASGQEVISDVLELTQPQQSFTFTGITEQPVPSLLRGFSAPVKLEYGYSRDDLLLLMRFDQDGFCRWDAGQKLLIEEIETNIQHYQAGGDLVCDDSLWEAFRGLIKDGGIDKAMLARMLILPSEGYLAEIAELIDPLAIYEARLFCRQQLATYLEHDLLRLYEENQLSGPYRPESADIACRALANTCLGYLILLDKPEYHELALTQFKAADNMTNQSAALRALVHSGRAQDKARALQEFYDSWKNDPQVVDQWLAVQAASPVTSTLERVQELMQHDAFSMTNPNKVRSLIGVFAGQNAVNFHRKDGAGYQFLVSNVIDLNKRNPQIASRLLTPLTRWRRYQPEWQTMMKAALEQIQAQSDLSKDVFEVVTKSLK